MAKPHTIGEQIILPIKMTIEKVFKTVLHKSKYDILNKIPFSNNTVQRLIDEMGHDVENYLCDYLQTTRFSIKLDESTLPGNEITIIGIRSFCYGSRNPRRAAFHKNYDYRHQR